MQLVLKSVQILCLSFLTCDSLFLQNVDEDKIIYQKSACTIRCLELSPQMDLHGCYYEICDKNFSKEFSKNILHQTYENHYIELFCRDDSNLTFRVLWKEFTSGISLTVNNSSRVNKNDNEKYISPYVRRSDNEIYIVKIYKAVTPLDVKVVLSNSTYIKVDDLESDTLYNITVTVVNSYNEYSIIVRNSQFRTLPKKYDPGMVKNVKLYNYIEDETDNKLLQATILWQPSADKTCHYEMIFYSPENSLDDVKPIEIRDLEHLYNYTIGPLALGTKYAIGIRSENTKEESKESNLTWLYIKTPSCLEWHPNDLTICPPLEPLGLEATEEILGINEYSINITWEKASLEPDYYVIKIFDLDMSNEFESTNLTANVSKDQNTYFIPRIVLNGRVYEVQLTAFTKGGSAKTYISKPLKIVQISAAEPILRYIIAIFVPLTMFALITMITFIICHRRAKIKRYKERCKYFEELEKKAPMDPNSNFAIDGRNLSLEQLQLDLEDKLFFNDEMEIKLADVQLFEVIGEGAFGFVRRGKLKINEKKETDVAVKMLKDQPTIEDIKTFRREIEVMKSVGKHPHIVNIVGHYTKNLKEMMLLTEYCSLGNLLDLLRAEWQRINKIVYIQKTTLTPSNSPPGVPYNTKYTNSYKINFSDKKPMVSIVSTKQFPNISSHSENIFNFDKEFIDKTKKLKYKNIGEDNKLREYNGCNHSKKLYHNHRYHHNNNNYNCNKIHKHNKSNYYSKVEKYIKSLDVIANETASTLVDETNQNSIKFKNHLIKQKSDIIDNIKINSVKLDKLRNLHIEKNNDENDNGNANIVINKGYGLQTGFCTNFCKCQVDIINLPSNSTNTSHQNSNFEQNKINSNDNNVQQNGIETKDMTSLSFQMCLNLNEIQKNDNNNCSAIANDDNRQLLDSNGSDDIIIHQEIPNLLCKNQQILQQFNNNCDQNKKFSNINKIQIKNCDCKLNSMNTQKEIAKTNINNLSNNLLMIDDDTSDIQTNVTTLTSIGNNTIINCDSTTTAPTTLLIENQGYYKFLNLNSNCDPISITNNIETLKYHQLESQQQQEQKQQDKITESNEGQNDESNDITEKDDNNDILKKGFNNYDLINIAKQIAMGMEYLAKCKVVHRDLAARNVLVCKDRTVKIADFGLSRDVYQENVYKKTGNGKLPIKWLALESMTHQVYTTQSDVWSYGILLYEIATLGGTPYPSISTNRLLQLLKNGYRMEKPKNCGQALYDLMSSCWKANPSQRPTFPDIIQNLDEILSKLPNDIQIENLEDTNSDKKSKSVSDESYLNPLL